MEDKALQEKENLGMSQKEYILEDVVGYIKKNYPETDKFFQKELNNMYLTFCRKQYDYGPNNIAMGTMLQTDEEIKKHAPKIVRVNEKNRIVKVG